MWTVQRFGVGDRFPLAVDKNELCTCVCFVFIQNSTLEQRCTPSLQSAVV